MAELVSSLPIPVPPNIKDATGFKANKLTVIGYLGMYKRCCLWLCQCECGKMTQVQTRNLKKILSCGCEKGIEARDLTGERFGSLVVVGPAEKDSKGRPCWNCKCDCGGERIHSAKRLHSGAASCGCGYWIRPSRPRRVLLMRSVEKTESCWNWTGKAKTNFGYGIVGGKLGNAVAHRVSWEVHNGPIPDGMQVLHRCDNPACVNPDHLFLGDHQANMDDMAEKGRRGWRIRRGAANGRAKLSWADVDEMRRLRTAGETVASIAEKFGVGRSAAGRVVRHECYKDEYRLAPISEKLGGGK